MSDKKILIILFAGISGASGILIVIATAHNPSDMVAADLLRIQTAKRCQFWHALALMGLSALGWTVSPNLMTSTALGFAFSNLFFAAAFIHINFTKLTLFAWIVPFCGLILAINWLSLALFGWRASKAVVQR